MGSIFERMQPGNPNRFSVLQWIGLVVGAAFGALFGYAEYGEPWLGALVGTGLATPIALLVKTWLRSKE